MKSPRLSLAVLLGAQAQVAFNLGATMMLLVDLSRISVWPGALGQVQLGPLLGALLVLAFVFLGPISGWLADRFRESAVLNVALAGQVLVMLALTAALGVHSPTGATAAFAGLAVLAAVVGPAKRGVLCELVGARHLSRAVGAMEMLAVAGIFAGIFGGNVLFITLAQWKAQAHGVAPIWNGAGLTAAALFSFALVSWLAFLGGPVTTVHAGEPFRLGLLGEHGRMVTELWRNRRLFRAASGVMFFYGICACLLVVLFELNGELHQRHPEFAVSVALLALLLGAGIASGNFAAGLLSPRGVELGLAPIGGAVLGAALFALGWIGNLGPAFRVWLVVAGFGAGFLLVPLQAYLAEFTGGVRGGQIVATVGMLSGLAVLMGNGLLLLLGSDRFLGWTPAAQLFVLAALTLAMFAYGLWHLPHQTVCAVMRLIGPAFYRVQARGRENLPAGGALIICNHLSYVDAVVLQIASPRPLRFVAFAGFARSPAVRFLFRAAGVIPMNAGHPGKGIRTAVDAIKRGELVCVFPEGAISRTGQLMELQRGFSAMSELAGAPVVPAVIDGLWGSVFSFAGHKYLWKSPRLMPTHVLVLFGRPIPPGAVSVNSARQALLDLGAEAFHERPTLRRHLAREAVRALAKRPGHVEVIDRTVARREVRAAQLLAAVAVLSRRIRRIVPEKRVGIVLPPGAGAHIANLAVACAGKTPVNLNFTVGAPTVTASLKLGEIRTVISAAAMREKLPNFPFPERTLDLREEMQRAGGKAAMLPWLVAAWLLPNQWFADLLGLPRRGDHDEAALLFTSGSSGEPKGVVLTHRNILANCAQVSSLSILPRSAVMIGCLPVFHSFGFTVTVWYPLLRGCQVVTLPSPLDTRKIVEAIHQERATVLVAAPTFIRPFLKKATREELQSLALVVTGAEKLPPDLHAAFLEQYGIEILQGYGLTETSPVGSVNQPHPPITTSTAGHQEGKRLGSVGRLLPALTARIVNPETGEQLPYASTGLLWLKGPNIFSGYLHDPEKTNAALKDGWFNTGDLGRLDDDGFLFIEGRLSRFSKIGGEMVPHGTIEQRLMVDFAWDQTEGPTAVITSVPDATKGEALVLLTTAEVTLADVRARLSDAGLPNLWLPKFVCRVEAIPVLGTGKIDLKACRQLAVELLKGSGGR